MKDTPDMTAPPDPAPVEPMPQGEARPDPLPVAGDQRRTPEADAATDADGAAAPVYALKTHLAQVPRKAPWTLEKDQELFHLAALNWPMGDIALELRVAVPELKARFDMLTDKRRFARADVLAALTAQMLAAVEADDERRVG